MDTEYKRALRYCYDGMLKVTKDNLGHELFCYTQACFFGKDTWNNTTKSHRGVLYKGGKQVNKPFTKIFNVDEVSETSSDIVSKRMETEPYDVMHKSNGHLFIMSVYEDDNGNRNIVPHTKGSLYNEGNDLLKNDIELFQNLYFNQNLDRVLTSFPNSTWMFEAIVDHDKHSMYEFDSERYGHDCFVLLGVNVKEDEEWIEVPRSELEQLAELIGCPCVDFYSVDDEKDLEEDFSLWYDHSSTEGYVIWFPKDGTRVKIKTKEYWATRFKKDLSTDVILNKFKKNGKRYLQEKLPEEVSDKIIEILDQSFGSWWYTKYINVPKIGGLIFQVMDTPLTREERAELFKRGDLTIQQKQVLAAISDGKKPFEQVWDNAKLRSTYVEYVNDNEDMFQDLECGFREIINEI